MPIARPVLFTQDARAEVIAAQDWYEGQAPGLVAGFRCELVLTVQSIADNALRFPVVFRDERRALVRHFPCSLLFHVELDAVTVIACFHARRDPQEWQRRS